MTLDELQLQAEKYGYRLVKLPEKISTLPCPVCAKRVPKSGFCALIPQHIFVNVLIADLMGIMERVLVMR